MKPKDLISRKEKPLRAQKPPSVAEVLQGGSADNVLNAAQLAGVDAVARMEGIKFKRKMEALLARRKAEADAKQAYEEEIWQNYKTTHGIL